MKKLWFILFGLLLASFLATTAATAGASPAAQTELGQLKVCKAGGSGVTQGQLFTIRVNNTEYLVPAGFCVLAGQFALNTQVTIQEVIPPGYYVAAISTRPSSSLQSKDTTAGRAVVQIGSGVTEVIYTNLPSGVPTSTPRPTETPGTGTPQPTGRLQICKEAGDPSVTGYFNFRFQSRTFRVPVGACSVLVHVGVGALTVTEDERSGFTVENIYTIPADRLISKDLNGRSATIQIVEGTAASQTILVFRNHSVGTTPTATPTITVTGPTPTPSHTPTPTVTGSASPTPTNTATSTPTPTGSASPTPTGTITCTPAIITADFSNIPVGGSVEVPGAVAPNLTIDSRNGTAIKVAEGVSVPSFAYLAPNAAPGVTPIANGGLAQGGGFSDVRPQGRTEPHHYTFTFAQPINYFTLRMLDFGDLNLPAPMTPATNHFASITAYSRDAQGNLVPIGGPFGRQELDYTTNAIRNPRRSSLYGDLYFNGDAVTAPQGQPGNWIWAVAGNGIEQVILEFGDGWDPNIAFDSLAFNNECGCQSLFTTDLNRVAIGASVEGLNTVGQDLDINANYGTAVRVVEGQPTPTFAYLAPNGAPGVTPVPNGGLVAGGGFTDLDAKRDGQAHKYTFSFTPGKTITFFALHMLDYGDLNMPAPLPPSINHLVSMTAYGRDAQGNLVPIPGIYTNRELRYTTDPAIRNPRDSNLYGDLYFTGDAVTAPRGQPGNWLWIVSGNGIEQVVLEFGEGYDPNVAFDLLYYNVVCVQ
jgi:hypothetical protein